MLAKMCIQYIEVFFVVPIVTEVAGGLGNRPREGSIYIDLESPGLYNFQIVESEVLHPVLEYIPIF